MSGWYEDDDPDSSCDCGDPDPDFGHAGHEDDDDTPARCEDCRSYLPGELHIAGDGRWLCEVCDR